jgi:hypothetical protein
MCIIHKRRTKGALRQERVNSSYLVEARRQQCAVLATIADGGQAIIVINIEAAEII